MKICVIIRVYDRIEDLENNLHIIKRTWNNHEYHLIVVSNGKIKGYTLTSDIYALSDKVIELENNAGHLMGNSQLLMAGLNNICIENYDYTIILEADTWIYTDDIINKYVNLLNMSEAVWASALWYDRFYSLAVDFAVIKSSFLINNKDIFKFKEYPECAISNYLYDKKAKYIYIVENMNVMLPGYIKSYPYAPKGRFNIFLNSKMITHHVEDLSNGMEDKKSFFNLICGYNFFEIPIKRSRLELIKIYLIIFISKIFIRRSWYSRRKRNCKC